MHTSKHAAARLRQRAIPPLLVDLLLAFGASVPSGDGTSKYYFDKSAKRKIKAYAGPVARVLDEHFDVYVVVAKDTKVITVGHRDERIRRH